jgi:glycosyltransferase EpsF
VLEVIDTFGMGGAETWLMELLRHWAQNGNVQMDFVLTSGNPGVFDEEARNLGGQLHYIRYGRGHFRKFAKRFRDVLRAGRYDAIHDHTNYASGWHFLAGLGALPPVRITHIHNPWFLMEANYLNSPSRRLVTGVGKRLVDRLATDVCGTSSESLRDWGYRSGRPELPSVSVVHCGFDVGKFGGSRDEDRQSVLREFNWPASTKLVLFAGRLDRFLDINDPRNQKNSWFALKVVEAATRKDSDIRFLMAGADDGMRPQIEAHIREWGAGDSLRLIGVRQDIPRLMRAADLLLFPSVQEGLGMVAVEAQASALPVLASTAVPDEAVVIPQMYNALSLNASVEHWADAVLASLAKPRMNANDCRQAVENSPFSIVSGARALEKLYRTRQR